jgi:outer membrane biosynthesis protein TonB
MKLKYFLAISAIATSFVIFTAAEGGNAVEEQMKKINATVEADANEYMAQKKDECKATAVRQAEANAAEICATRSSSKAVVAPIPVPVKGKPAVKPGKVVVKTTPPSAPPTTVKPTTPAPPSGPVNTGKKVDATSSPDATNTGKKPAVDQNNAPEMINTGKKRGGGF